MRELPTCPRSWKVVTSARDKVFILLQMLFAGVNAPDKEKSEVSSVAMSQNVIYQAAPRIAKGETRPQSINGCLSAIAMARVIKYKATYVDESSGLSARPKMAQGLRHAIELQQILVGKAWPFTAMIFKQLALLGLSSKPSRPLVSIE